jgi:hypothetical protein
MPCFWKRLFEAVMLASSLRITIAMQVDNETSDEPVEYLRKDDNKTLKELTKMLCETIQKPRLKFTHCFYETLPTESSAVMKDLSTQFAEQLDGDKKGW